MPKSVAVRDFDSIRGGSEMKITTSENYFKYMIGKSKKFIPIILILQITTLAVGLINLYIASITQSFLDKILVQSSDNEIAELIFSLFVCGLLLFAMGLFNNFISCKFTNILNFAIRSDFLKSMEYHNFTFFNNHSSSEIYYRMFQDTSVMTSFFINLFISLPVQIIYIAFVFKRMLSISSSLSLYAVILLIVQMICVIVFKTPIKNLVSKQKTDEQEVVYNVNEYFQKIEVVKTLGIEDALKNKFDSVYRKYVSSNIKNSFLLKFFGSTSELINQAWLFSTIFISGFLLNKGLISLGGIFSFLIISRTFFNPVLKLLNTFINFEECKVSFSRYMEFYGTHIGDTEKVLTHKLNSSFSIKGLTFYYDRNNVIFDNISLTFKAGELIAIKGESGIGKTTLFRIISRFIEPQKGILTVDGVNINKIETKAYIKDFGLLLQTPIIFDDTIKFNLSFDKDFSDEELFEVLAYTGLNEFVCKQPDKLNTLIGVKGIRLSEGQAQRLSLARILLRKPKILWLDEPTAQLDYNNRIELIKIVDRYRKSENAIVVISTHDQIVLDQVDTIYEIKNCKITPIK